MRNDDDLDKLLDAGLASYAAAEPRTGLERRVLAHVTAARRRPWMWWLAVAAPVAAALFVIATHRPAATPQAPPTPIAQTQSVPTAAPVVVAPVRQHMVRRVARVRPAKRDQFPTPAP